MNKKQGAVAIAGLLAAPLAQAQTANCSRCTASRTSIWRSLTAANWRMGKTNDRSGSTPTRRASIRATQSLGGGLNAIFRIENGLISVSSAGGASPAATLSSSGGGG